MKTCTIITIIASVLLGLGILLTVILVPLSIDYVYPGEYGLLYNSSNKKIENEYYNNGRYFIGLSNKFLRFPSQLFEIKFEKDSSIECITSNYQTINLEIFIELRFNLKTKTALYDFYSRYGSNWIEIIKQSIIHNIIEIAANFNLFDFFEKRAEFKQGAFNEISKNLSNNTLDILLIKSLKLINVHFSPNLSLAIEEKLIEKQNTRAVQIEGQINFVNKQTEGLIRIADKEINSINQVQYSNYENTKINTHFKCLDMIIRADADSYKDLNNDLGLNSDNNLINFIYSLERNKFSGKQFINFQSFTINKK